MWRFIVTILCVVAQIQACALCALYTPNVYVSVEIKGDLDANQSIDLGKSNANHSKDSRESSANQSADSPTIKSIVFLWKFDKKFNQVLLHSYDTNANGVIDKNELKSIESALTSYVLPKNNLTHALLQRTNDKPKPINFRLKKYEIFIQDETLNYRYEIVLDSAPKERFSFMVSDDEGFFNFIIFSQKHTIIGDKRVSSKVIDDNVIIFTIENARSVDSNAFGAQDLANLNGANLRNESIMDKMFALNAKMLSDIKSHIVGENEGEKSVFGILGLMALSLLYGVLHATAPGHAKLLTSSYFLSHKGSYAKAFGFALRVGIVHIVSAFVLVGLGLFVLKIVVQSLANDANAIITQISSAIIIVVALALLVRKMRGKHAHTCGCESCQNHALNANAPNNSSAKNPRSMLANALNAMQSTFQNISPKIAPNIDFAKWGVIIAAGIVPCPSMILVLLLCFEVGFFSAFLSAICIAIGMSAVVFVSAILAHKVRLSAGSEKISRALEYLALCGMLCVAIFMFANAKSGVF